MAVLRVDILDGLNQILILANSRKHMRSQRQSAKSTISNHDWVIPLFPAFSDRIVQVKDACIIPKPRINDKQRSHPFILSNNFLLHILHILCLNRLPICPVNSCLAPIFEFEDFSVEMDFRAKEVEQNLLDHMPE